MPHEERTALNSASSFALSIAERRIWPLVTWLIPNYQMVALDFTWDCLSLCLAFDPEPQQTPPLHMLKVGGKSPSLERAVELQIPRPQPALTKQLVSPWMQCLSVFKKCCSCFWHFTKVILQFLLKQCGRGAYGKTQLWHSQPHCKAPWIKSSSTDTTSFSPKSMIYHKHNLLFFM